MCASSFGECGYRPDYSGTLLESHDKRRELFGENLFRDWRYNADGTVNKDFVLNNPTYGERFLWPGRTSVAVPVANMRLGQ